MDKQKNEEEKQVAEDVTEYKVIDKASTVCEHFWVEEGINSGMTSVICNKCWSGAQFNPSSAKVVDGKLIWL